MKKSSSVDDMMKFTQALETAEQLRRRADGPVFNTSLDKVGLEQESPKYASQKCRWCYGKGWLIRHVQPVSSPDGAVYTKFHVVCDCVHKGYTKVRKALEAKVEKALSEQGEIVTDLPLTNAIP